MNFAGALATAVLEFGDYDVIEEEIRNAPSTSFVTPSKEISWLAIQFFHKSRLMNLFQQREIRKVRDLGLLCFRI
jgi:hypothetical protein